MKGVCPGRPNAATPAGECEGRPSDPHSELLSASSCADGLLLPGCGHAVHAHCLGPGEQLEQACSRCAALLLNPFFASHPAAPLKKSLNPFDDF